MLATVAWLVPSKVKTLPFFVIVKKRPNWILQHLNCLAAPSPLIFSLFSRDIAVSTSTLVLQVHSAAHSETRCVDGATRSLLENLAFLTFNNGRTVRFVLIVYHLMWFGE